MYSLLRAAVLALLGNVRWLFFFVLFVGSFVVAWRELSSWPLFVGFGAIFITRGILGEPADE